MCAYKAVKVTDNVYWVGAIDTELRDFHGYSTLRGTTYNAYLVMGSKPVLIDTVKVGFFDEMMSRISSLIDPKKIKYIISNHAEMDHSGSLPKVIETIKPEKVFASKMGVQALKKHFCFNLDITEVKSQEVLNIDGLKFTFIETRMLHWPDSMFTYFNNDKVLFSQDAFGMHLATYKLFADQNDYAIMHYESAKYFANILLPYANLVTKLFASFDSFNLDVQLIAPDHGPVWRTQKDISWIISLWRKWALQEKSQKVVIIYDTMWNSTAKMAKVIADSIAGEDVDVKLMPLSISHRSDVATELLEAKAFIVGSPTINQQMFPTVADVLCYLKGLKPQGLIGQVFGSYGWGCESVRLVCKELETIGVKFIDEPIKAQYVPDDEVLAQCRLLGKSIAKELKNG